MPKQEINIKPVVQFTCRHCIKWSRYKGENQNWGVCTVKDVPNYMREMYIDNGCNLHSNINTQKIGKKSDNEQLSLFN